MYNNTPLSKVTHNYSGEEFTYTYSSKTTSKVILGTSKLYVQVTHNC